MCIEIIIRSDHTLKKMNLLFIIYLSKTMCEYLICPTNWLSLSWHLNLSGALTESERHYHYHYHHRVVIIIMNQQTRLSPYKQEHNFLCMAPFKFDAFLLYSLVPCMCFFAPRTRPDALYLSLSVYIFVYNTYLYCILVWAKHFRKLYNMLKSIIFLGAYREKTGSDFVYADYVRWRLRV